MNLKHLFTREPHDHPWIYSAINKEDCLENLTFFLHMHAQDTMWMRQNILLFESSLLDLRGILEHKYEINRNIFVLL